MLSGIARLLLIYFITRREVFTINSINFNNSRTHAIVFKNVWSDKASVLIDKTLKRSFIPYYLESIPQDRSVTVKFKDPKGIRTISCIDILIEANKYFTIKNSSISSGEDAVFVIDAIRDK